jgi:predicted RNA-binding Zn-ribbon protein involved in translation (DUF1610 family)
MSDTARDLLVHGVAAAKANDREQARFYLEWVLRTDADLEQQTEAWYNLSLITDEPEEKRQCLENVLAAYPGHGEARRDLAILEGRIKPADLVDQMRPVGPLAPGSELTQEDVQGFKCPRCGAAMAFDPRLGTLACGFCGYRKSDSTGGQAPQSGEPEQDWVAAMYTRRGHRWELPLARTLTCRGCGAVMTVQPGLMTTGCPFCGASHVIETDESRELIQPEAVLRFAFDAAAARGHGRAWLEQTRFRPEDLDEEALFAPPRSVYIPCWNFDISSQLYWNGYVMQRQQGQLSSVPTSGVISNLFDNVLVPASASISEEELDALRFDVSAAVPYSAGLLAHWPAEIYTISMADAAVAAHDHAFKRSEAAAPLEVEVGPADLVNDLKIDRRDISMLSYKLLLLPVWITSYSYQGREYRVLINGHSGRVHGAVPRGGFQRLLDDLLGEDE